MIHTNHTDNWVPPSVDTSRLVPGDMPGDKIQVNENHISKANKTFPLIADYLKATEVDRLVVSVYGGSGVGKSEVGAVLGYYCTQAGFPAYVMSGDNYPYRCPPQNDAERLNRFRVAGLTALTQETDFLDMWVEEITATWPTGEDSNPSMGQSHPHFAIYQSAGRVSLENYLGSPEEIDFFLVNSIISRFKSGESSIPLKRMGRTPEDLCFENVDFITTRVMIIEWTHGGSFNLQGIDLPIFLYSSPSDTLAHRKARGRDTGVDTSFIQMILEIEQAMLNSQASRAALILGSDNASLSANQILEKNL